MVRESLKLIIQKQPLSQKKQQCLSKIRSTGMLKIPENSDAAVQSQRISIAAFLGQHSCSLGKLLHTLQTSWTSSERLMCAQFTSCAYWVSAKLLPIRTPLKDLLQIMKHMYFFYQLKKSWFKSKTQITPKWSVFQYQKIIVKKIVKYGQIWTLTLSPCIYYILYTLYIYTYILYIIYIIYIIYIYSLYIYIHVFKTLCWSADQ